MSIQSEPVFFNPLEPGYIENPWPHLSTIREADPVHHLLTGQYLLFRYDDVFAVLRDPSLSVDDNNVNMEVLDRAALFEEMDPDQQNRSILNIDPPDHTRLRRLISKAFTPRTIEALRPRIQAMVDDALDAIEGRGGGDIVAELAFPLPFDVISEMLGMPAADKDQIKQWSGALVKTLDPIITEEEVAAAIDAGTRMDTLIDEVVAWKRANPSDDLLSAMIAAEEDGDRMTARELRDQVSVLFIAGHETTVNLIGTGTYELLRHPDQLALWQQTELPNAVDELLRWVSPVQISRRVTIDELVVRGVTIPPGSFVLTSLASANHDPGFWGDTAETLDLTRTNAGQHVSFGSGVHYCLGASLAKLEAEIAIGSLIKRFDRITVDGEPGWNGRINLRGLESLPVSVR